MALIDSGANVRAPSQAAINAARIRADATRSALPSGEYHTSDIKTTWGNPAAMQGFMPSFTAPTATANPAAKALTGRAAALSAQTMLKRLGYAVSVDGVIGPQTKSALAAQKSGIKPAVWNTNQVGAGTVTPPTGTGSPSILANSDNNQTPPPAKNSLLDDIIAREKAALPGDNSQRILGLEGLLSKGQVDANLLAKADAGQVYDPVISALRQNISQQTNQGAQNQSDIKGWYDALVANIGARNKSNVAGDQQAINGITSATSGVASALGLDPGTAGGDNIYQTGNIQASAARANLASERSYGADLQGVTGAQGLQALISQRNTDANKLSDLQTQERAQEGARGQAVVTSRAAYRQQNLTNREQYTQDKLAIEKEAQNSKQQHFGNVAAMGSQKIAVANSKNALVIAGDKVAAGTKKADQQYKVARINARARIMSATAGLVKARTSQLAALTKFKAASASLFPGLSGKDSANTLFNIQDKIGANTSLFDKTGKIIPGRQQAVVKAVRTSLVKAGADPRLSVEAKYQAFNMLEAFGITPHRDWYGG